MGRNYKYIKKIASWGGKNRDLENVIRTARRYTQDPTAIEMISNFYMLLSATDYLNEVSFEVLIKGRTIEEIAKEQNKSVNGTYKPLWKQYKKINEIFADDLIDLIRDSEKNKDKIAYYRMVAQQLIPKYRPIEYLEYAKLFTFDIINRMQVDHQYNMNVSPAEFEAAIELLQMTVTPFMEMMLEQIDVRMYGYIMNLLKGDKYNLTERDLARKEHLETSWLLNI